jgi:hypothetical protein
VNEKKSGPAAAARTRQMKNATTPSRPQVLLNHESLHDGGELGPVLGKADRADKSANQSHEDCRPNCDERKVLDSFRWRQRMKGSRPPRRHSGPCEFRRTAGEAKPRPSGRDRDYNRRARRQAHRLANKSNKLLVGSRCHRGGVHFRFDYVGFTRLPEKSFTWLSPTLLSVLSSMLAATHFKAAVVFSETEPRQDSLLPVNPIWFCHG